MSMRGGLLVSLLVGLLGIGQTLSYTQLIAWYVISCWTAPGLAGFALFSVMTFVHPRWGVP